MVLGNMPHINTAVTGIRINQRQKQFSFLHFRLELWMTHGDENHPEVKDLRKYLEEQVIDDILKDMSNVVCKFDDRAAFKEEMKQKNK